MSHSETSAAAIYLLLSLLNSVCVFFYFLFVVVLLVVHLILASLARKPKAKVCARHSNQTLTRLPNENRVRRTGSISTAGTETGLASYATLRRHQADKIQIYI